MKHVFDMKTVLAQFLRANARRANDGDDAPEFMKRTIAYLLVGFLSMPITAAGHSAFMPLSDGRQPRMKEPGFPGEFTYPRWSATAFRDLSSGLPTSAAYRKRSVQTRCTHSRSTHDIGQIGSVPGDAPGCPGRLWRRGCRRDALGTALSLRCAFRLRRSVSRRGLSGARLLGRLTVRFNTRGDFLKRLQPMLQILAVWPTFLFPDFVSTLSDATLVRCHLSLL